MPVKIVKQLGLKNVSSITETYRALRCKGYAQPKAMERVIHFTKVTPSVREKVIRDMLRAEKTLGRSCKRKK